MHIDSNIYSGHSLAQRHEPQAVHLTEAQGLHSGGMADYVRVKPGDTWERIAKANAITIAQLKRANGATYVQTEPKVDTLLRLPANKLPSLSESRQAIQQGSSGAAASLKQSLSKESLAADVKALANNPGANRTIGPDTDLGKPHSEIPFNTPTTQNGATSFYDSNNTLPQTTDVQAAGRNIVLQTVNGAINAEIAHRINRLKAAGKNYRLISNLTISLNPTITADKNWINDWSIDTTGPLGSWSDTTYLNLQLGGRHQYQRNYGDVGLVARRLVSNQKYMIGGNVFVDRDFTGANTRYSVGGEFFAPYVKSSVNLYRRVTGWRPSPFNFLREERIANGYDLNVVGYLPFAPSLSVMGGVFQYFGDQVDVLHNGVFLKDPTGFQFGVTWAPVPLYQVMLSATRSGGQLNSQLSFAMNYRIGQPLSEQLKPVTPASVADMRSHLNDLVLRNYTPVLEERERKFPITFAAGPSYYQGLNELTTLNYNPNIQGGYGVLTYSLVGADAAKFAFNPLTQILSWAPGFTPVYSNPQDSTHQNLYQTTILVSDNHGDSASQSVSIKIFPTGVTPTAQDLATQKQGINPLGDITPRIGDTLKAEYKFIPGSSNQVEVPEKTMFQWYLNGRPILGATQRLYAVPKTDWGGSLTLGVRVAAQDKDKPGQVIYARDFAMKDLGIVAPTYTTPTSVFISLPNGTPIGDTPPINTKDAQGGAVPGTPLTATLVCYIGQDSACTDGGAVTYQWQRWTSRTNEAWENIAGATQKNYNPTFDDLGRKIQVVITLSNP